MAIKDILLPLVGEPTAAATAAIDKCMAVAGDIGARVTALAIEEDILVRPRVMISADLDNAAVAEANGPQVWRYWMRSTLTRSLVISPAVRQFLLQRRG